jgi:hypothetical protein
MERGAAGPLKAKTWSQKHAYHRRASALTGMNKARLADSLKASSGLGYELLSQALKQRKPVRLLPYPKQVAGCCLTLDWLR